MQYTLRVSWTETAERWLERSQHYTMLVRTAVNTVIAPALELFLILLSDCLILGLQVTWDATLVARAASRRSSESLNSSKLSWVL